MEHNILIEGHNKRLTIVALHGSNSINYNEIPLAEKCFTCMEQHKVLNSRARNSNFVQGSYNLSST